jgi:hypothetical protein
MGTNLSGSSISSTYQTLLKVDGGVDGTLKMISDGDGTDTNTKVSTSGISTGTITTSSTLTVGDGSTPASYTPAANADNFIIESTGDAGLTILSGDTNDSTINLTDTAAANGSTGGVIGYDNNTQELTLKNGNVTGVKIDGTGKTTFGSFGTTPPREVKNLTATASLVATDDFVIYTSNTGSQTITLPAKANLTGKSITILNAGDAILTVTANGSETINKQSNAVLPATASDVHSCVTLTCTGVAGFDWVITAMVGAVTVS